MIWCDLDETLIWAVPLDAPRSSRLLFIATLGFDPDAIRGNVPRRIVAKGEKEVIVAGARYAVQARPGVKRLLAALRRLDRVRLLTLASRPYALRMNRVFELGFKPREIVARESFEARFSDLLPKATNVDPGGVLIQNHEGGSNRGCQAKCAYLGIQRDGRCVKTSRWRHQVEPWRELVREVKAAMALPDEEIIRRRHRRIKESHKQLEKAVAKHRQRDADRRTKVDK